MKILIVEDEFTSRVLLQTILSQYGETHIAVDGEEAVQAVQNSFKEEDPYDLICMDIMMPKMDGQAALKRIREIEGENGVLVGRGATMIMTTALNDSKNVMEAFNEQCEAYIVKPINKDKLVEQLIDLGLVEKSTR